MLPARPASRAGARTHARALCLFLLPWLLPLLAAEAVRADYVPGALLHAEDFQSYGDGDDPAQWLDTGANNSLVEEPAVFETTVLGDGNVVFGTSSHRRSTHSHFAPPGSEGWSAYQVSGRMFPGSDQAGIGVSIYSGFGDSADYYRLMHDRSAGFRLAGLRHDCQGNTDTGTLVDPASWYRFRLQAFPDGQGTRLRAGP